MDFSWFGITVIDIGIVSIGVIGFAWIFRRMIVLERENGGLRAQVNALEQEINALKQENQELKYENRELRKDFEVLAGRYAEIKEILTLILKREEFGG